MPSFQTLRDRHKGDPGIFVDIGGISRGDDLISALSGIVVSSPGNAVPCRMCEATIEKGKSCFAWVSRTARAFTNVSGQTRSPYLSTGVRWFVHFDCLLDNLRDLADSNSVGCAFCGADVDLEPCRRRTRVYRLCEDCARAFPMTCMVCSLRVSFNESSWSIEPWRRSRDPFGNGDEPVEEREGVVCDGCAESYCIETVNTRRRRHADERRERAEIRQHVADVEGWLAEDA